VRRQLRTALALAASAAGLVTAGHAAGPALAAVLASPGPAATAPPTAPATPTTPPLPAPPATATPTPAPSATPSPSPDPSPQLEATPFNGTPAVGALFNVTKAGLKHFCTAAVVRSKHGNLLITAAHCLTGARTGAHGSVVFAPGYHDGKFPHGRWQVMSVLADTSWRRHHDPNDDVAFLVVGRDGHRIQKYTGADTVAIGTALPKTVRVIGYPNRADVPVTCTGQASKLALAGYQQLVFPCGGYTNGTSGGPFLLDVSARSGDGSVIGVIGGYQRGGKLASVSYSARFLRNVAALYQQAQRA
jgi:V8-like Glu-specific endopeptidase